MSSKTENNDLAHDQKATCGGQRTFSPKREKPSIEMLKKIFQEIDINNDETLQKSELKKAAMLRNNGSLISKYLPPKVFLTQCEKIFRNTQDGINFNMFCKIFFKEQTKLNIQERRRLLQTAGVGLYEFSTRRRWELLKCSYLKPGTLYAAPSDAAGLCGVV